MGNSNTNNSINQELKREYLSVLYNDSIYVYSSKILNNNIDKDLWKVNLIIIKNSFQ